MFFFFWGGGEVQPLETCGIFLTKRKVSRRIWVELFSSLHRMEKVKFFLKCFSDVLKGILVFETLFFSLGDTFGNVFQAIVAFTSFSQENAVLISKSC